MWYLSLPKMFCVYTKGFPVFACYRLKHHRPCTVLRAVFMFNPDMRNKNRPIVF